MIDWRVIGKQFAGTSDDNQADFLTGFATGFNEIGATGEAVQFLAIANALTPGPRQIIAEKLRRMAEYLEEA